MLARTVAHIWLISLVVADDLQTCYGYDGYGYPNNVVCPGSSACCGVGDDCLSNRLCHNADDPTDLLVRGPCAIWPWDESRCGSICLWNETQDSPSGTFPRVNVCSDGSYCCNTFDVECCSEGRGIWLDSSGNVLSATPTTTIIVSTWYAGSVSLSYVGPVSTSSSTSISSTVTEARLSTTTTYTTSSIVSSTKPSSDPAKAATTTSLVAPTITPSIASGTSGHTTVTRIGIGVATAVGIVALAILAFCLRRQIGRKRHSRIPKPLDSQNYYYGGWLSSKDRPVDAHEMHDMNAEPPELHGESRPAELAEHGSLLQHNYREYREGLPELE